MKKTFQTLLVVPLIFLLLSACQTVGGAGAPPADKSSPELASHSALLSEAMVLSTPGLTGEPGLLNSVALTAAAPEVPIPAGCTITADADFEDAVFRLINEKRAQENLPELAGQPQLYAAARSHSLDMACKDFFSHNGSDASSPFERIRRAGYTFSVAAENLYAGSESLNDPAKAVDAWMNSPGHRDNILNASVIHMGVSYVSSASGRYHGYVTVLFAGP